MRVLIFCTRVALCALSIGISLLYGCATSEERRAKEGWQRCRADRTGMIDVGNGVLGQCRTGLEWTEADNGADINWENARRWCTSKGEGWRLPVANELETLGDASSTPDVPCGRFTCKVSPSFRLTGSWLWSGDAAIYGGGYRWFVDLNSGNRSATSDLANLNWRALCVRHP
jgi:hypothetical protein